MSEALGLFEFFKVGSKRDVILLGEGKKVPVHHVKSKRHKILCTASTGLCEACDVCGTSPDVSTPQVEVHVPALRKEKDRRFHQCIAVFTELQFETLIEPLTTEEGERGLRIEVLKENPKKATVKTVKGSPRSRAASLPEAFDLLPWVRGRWCRPQDPEHPPVRLEPVSISDSERGSGRAVKPLALTADDRGSPEEMEAVRVKMAEARAMFSGTPVVSPIDPVPAAPVPPAPAVQEPIPAPLVVEAAPVSVPTGFVTVPVDVTTPPPAPRPTPPHPLAGPVAEQTEADLSELETRLRATPQSTGMVPHPERASVAAERATFIRSKNAEGVAHVQETRAALMKRARDGEDLGAGRAVPANDTFNALISNIANGGAK